jgi:hypothetical protein
VRTPAGTSIRSIGAVAGFHHAPGRRQGRTDSCLVDRQPAAQEGHRPTVTPRAGLPDPQPRPARSPHHRRRADRAAFVVQDPLACNVPAGRLLGHGAPRGADPRSAPRLHRRGGQPRGSGVSSRPGPAHQRAWGNAVQRWPMTGGLLGRAHSPPHPSPLPPDRRGTVARVCRVSPRSRTGHGVARRAMRLNA